MITEGALKDILKPRNSKWRTSITKVEPNRLTTRGYQQEELIGNISFSEMIHLLLKGKLPHKNQAKMLSAVLTSFCDHGVTPPSTQTARLLASAGSPLPTCIGGGLLAFGKNHAGAIECAMKMLQDGIFRNPDDIDHVIEEQVNDFIKNRIKIPGFGHRYHQTDPRVPRLIELAKKYDCLGKHTQLALDIEDILFKKKEIRMNIDGANAGILSDIGFDWSVGSGIFMIGRLPGILAHVNEELTEEPPFRKFFEVDEINYDIDSLY